MVEMRKRLLTVSLAKPRYIPESILRIYEQFIGGDMHYINGSFLKNVLKIDTVAQVLNCMFY
jgi:hypothetical protein